MNAIQVASTCNLRIAFNTMKTFILLALLSFSQLSIANKSKFNKTIDNFNEAKKFLTHNLELFESKTIYCSCNVTGKTVDLRSCNYKIQKDASRASRLEWEHVVPAEAFGQSFPEWRTGTPECIKRGKQYKGRKCAAKNPEFARMEGDLYNLFPEIGELNGLRSNYSMSALSSSDRDFGGCKVKLADRKFEPQDSSKGIVARTYLNFENRYPGRGVVSDKNKKLFEAWDKTYPVSKLECRRWKKLEPIAGYTHLFASRCKKLD